MRDGVLQLSCLLEQDANDIERGWEEAAAEEEALLAEASDGLFNELMGECAAEVAARRGEQGVPVDVE